MWCSIRQCNDPSFYAIDYSAVILAWCDGHACGQGCISCLFIHVQAGKSFIYNLKWMVRPKVL